MLFYKQIGRTTDQIKIIQTITNKNTDRRKTNSQKDEEIDEIDKPR